MMKIASFSAKPHGAEKKSEIFAFFILLVFCILENSLFFMLRDPGYTAHTVFPHV